MFKKLEPSTSESHSIDSSDDNVNGINESHILQDRKIGVFGAVSLIVNKIVGAG